MGEVWKAPDTTLKRDVAFKVLPAALWRDSDRMPRFQREAEVLLPDRPNLALSTRCRSRKGEDRQRYASLSTGHNEGVLTDRQGRRGDFGGEDSTRGARGQSIAQLIPEPS